MQVRRLRLLVVGPGGVEGRQLGLNLGELARRAGELLLLRLQVRLQLALFGHELGTLRVPACAV